MIIYDLIYDNIGNQSSKWLFNLNTLGSYLNDAGAGVDSADDIDFCY